MILVVLYVGIMYERGDGKLYVGIFNSAELDRYMAYTVPFRVEEKL